MNASSFKACLTVLLGEGEAQRVCESLEINADFLHSDKQTLNRAQIAMLMNVLLFKDLVERVPEAKIYTNEQRNNQRRITFDHGALRTVAVDMTHLPAGREAFARILEPMGYEMVGEYPLDKLKMCGFVYTHKDYPEDIPQYFVSELYPERFSPAFVSTVKALVTESKDPLSEASKTLLHQLKAEGYLDFESALSLLRALPPCFDRQHAIPTLAQYKQLLAESAEMAWISTEGNAFNHATDRVKNLDKLAHEERVKGRNMKPKIEEGINANIRQTAYRAAVVEREFRQGDEIITLEVPGSFFEFIERGTLIDPETGREKMDLRFDSRNAQGIFKMTEKD